MDQKQWLILIGLGFLAAGVLSIGGAALNLDLFFNSPKAQPIVDSLGRTGARVFYIAIGVVCLVAGVGAIGWGLQS